MTTSMIDRDTLIRVFKITKPWQLQYSKRKDYWKNDKPLLNELIKEGLVEVLEEDAYKILYRYKGQ